MADRARRRATYDDVLAAPAHVVAEILHGVLHTSPRPAPAHALAASRLGGELSPPFSRGRGGPGGWWILDEPELHFRSGDIVVPDVGGWRVEAMPALPETAYFEAVPDWICEVLSPSRAATDRAEKMPIYADAGVAHAWLVDPLLRTLEVFRRVETRWLLLGTFQGEAMVRAEPFDAVELELASLWASATPPRT